MNIASPAAALIMCEAAEAVNLDSRCAAGVILVMQINFAIRASMIEEAIVFNKT